MSVLIRNGGGSTRVKVDGIPPTERLNLSKIGGEKLIEIGIKTETSINSDLWKKGNKFVYLNRENRNKPHNLYIINSDGSIERKIEIKEDIYRREEIRVATVKNSIYLLIDMQYGTTVDLYKLNEDNSRTKIKSINKPNDYSNGNVRFCGVKNDDLYINIYNYQSSIVYKYNTVANSLTKAYSFYGYIDFMYLINGDFYTREGRNGGVLNLIKDGSSEITEICQKISNLIYVIDNEIYHFIPKNDASGGTQSFRIHKFNFDTNKFDFIKEDRMKIGDGSYYKLLPKMNYFVLALSIGEILRYVKELYLTEKREE